MELVAAQIVPNSVDNIRNSLQLYYNREVYGWSYSTVVLQCLQGNGSYKEFFHNRVKYINSKTPLTCRYVDSIQNPAHIGAKGVNVENLPKEWWMAYPKHWPKKKEIHHQRNLKKKSSKQPQRK